MTALRCAGFELPARDPEALGTFYRDALDFEQVGRRPDGSVELRLGNCELHLRAAPDGRAMPADSRSHDHWFRHIAIVVRDMGRAHAQALHHGAIAISAQPQTLPQWNADAAGIQAWYFRDPEGRPLELIRFPPGKGREQWHVAGDDLFQGVDHSAVVVGAGPHSAWFYQRTTGFGPVARSHNYGVEQERLSGVTGADLQVTTLSSADPDDRGPHIELLEYRAPRDGRPMPADTRADDAWAAVSIFRGGPAIGTGAHSLDPDGHRLVIS